MTINNDEDKTVIMGHASVGHGGHPANVGTQEPPKGRLICLDDFLLDPTQKGLEIVLDGADQTLGRAPDNTAPILYANISRYHARVFLLQGKWAVEDLNSANGVWIKGIREKQVFLVPGEQVKIGAVRFQFVLDGPGSPSLSREAAIEEEDGTMILSEKGPRTTQTVEPSPTHKEREPKTQKLEIAGNRGEPSVTTPQKTPPVPVPVPAAAVQSPPTVPEKSAVGKIVAIVLLLAIAGGGYLYTKSTPTADEVVRAQRTAITSFTDTYEVAKGILPSDALKEQISKLETLLRAVEADMTRYPKNLDLKDLHVHTYVLLAERQIVSSIQERQAQQMDAMVDTILVLVASDWEGATEKQLETTKGTRELLAVTKDILKIKRFRQRFPNPSRDAAIRPGLEETATLEKVGKQLTEQRKTPRISVLLSVRYPLLGRVAAQAEEEAVSLLKQWKEVL